MDTAVHAFVVTKENNNKHWFPVYASTSYRKAFNYVNAEYEGALESLAEEGIEVINHMIDSSRASIISKSEEEHTKFWYITQVPFSDFFGEQQVCYSDYKTLVIPTTMADRIEKAVNWKDGDDIEYHMKYNEKFSYSVMFDNRTRMEVICNGRPYEPEDVLFDPRYKTAEEIRGYELRNAAYSYIVLYDFQGEKLCEQDIDGFFGVWSVHFDACEYTVHVKKLAPWIKPGDDEFLEQAEESRENVFVYKKYHFSPIGQVDGEPSLEELSKKISTRGIGLNRYDDKDGWNYEEFYKVATDKTADLFLCIEDGNIYMPGENSLFLYEGSCLVLVNRKGD